MLHPLTGVRGLAALWVWLYHAWLVAGNRPIRLESLNLNLTPFFSQGWVGVDLFFVLSGFVLAWPYFGAQARAFSVGDFLRRRGLRVIPAYYLQFFLLLCAGASGFILDLPGKTSTLFHLLLAHNFREAWAFYLPWWTLPIEWSFYLVFPLLLPVFSRHRPWRALLVVLVFAIAWRTLAYFWLDHTNTDAQVNVGTRVWLMHQLPGRIDQFFLGMLSAWLTHRLYARLTVPAIARWSNGLTLSGGILLLFWMYVLAWNYEGYWAARAGLVFYWNSLAALCISIFLAGLALNGTLARILFANRLMRVFGEISYSMYLWHFAVLVALVHLGAFTRFGGEALFLWVCLISLPVMLLVSALSWWIAERPFLRYRERRSSSAHWLDRLITAPWRAFALTAMALFAFSWAANAYWMPASGQERACTQRSALDSPGEIPGLAANVTVAGWAYDWNPHDRLRRAVILAKDREVASTPFNEARQDVVQALSGCKVGRPGFSITLDTRSLPIDMDELSVMAERRSGERFEISRLHRRFAAPMQAIDRAQTPQWNENNLFIGWSWHPAGPVKVIWRSADQILWEGFADRQRQDLALAFPALDGVERSGFEFEADLATLPRGRYATWFEFVASDGNAARSEGPEVANDAPLGKVITAGGQHFVMPEKLEIDAWAFSEHGIASARVETESGFVLGALAVFSKKVPLSRLPDPRFPPGKRKATDHWTAEISAGTLFRDEIDTTGLPEGLHRLLVRVSDTRGEESLLPGPLVAGNLLSKQGTCTGEPFHVYLVADMEFVRRGIPLLPALRQMAESACVRIGLQMRIEYLRTTRGKSADFVFDADFPERLRRRNGREMLGVSLKTALQQADRFGVPLRLTLDGGVWADSRFPLPDYDIADWLEEDAQNVQWNQYGKAEADDALAGLAGATENPQLARMLGIGYYNQPFLDYKKRNLQAAVREIVAYNRQHPDRQVSINLDPDQYINPWFYRSQWYDYNPRALRQFREWLTHTGIYAEGAALAAFRPQQRLTLAEINRMAEAHWRLPDEIDPPRGTPDYTNPWHQRWTSFKRHLVARHYDDLARWINEAGLPSGLIHTSQTFIQTDVAVSENDPASGWTDEAGVSLSGAKPSGGHLGAILYGPASRNEGTVRSGNSLLENIAAIDAHWAVVEMHPATIERPRKLPSHDESYRTIASIYNHGARSLTVMWGSWAGDQRIHPEAFRAYDTLEQSSWETALLGWLRELSEIPAGSRLWTFGHALLASDDEFVAHPATTLVTHKGWLKLSAAEGKTGIGRKIPPYRIHSGHKLQVSGSGFNGAVVTFQGSALTTPLTVPLRQTETGLWEAPLDFAAGTVVERLDLSFDSKQVRLESIVLHAGAGQFKQCLAKNPGCR